MPATSTTHVRIAKFQKAKALLNGFFNDPPSPEPESPQVLVPLADRKIGFDNTPKSGFSINVVWNGASFDVFIPRHPTLDVRQVPDDQLDGAWAAFKVKLIQTRAVREEATARYQHLVKAGAIATVPQENTIAGFTGGDQHRSHILDEGKLEEAIAAYPYSNSRFPKPTIQTDGLKREDLKKKEPGAAVT